MCDPPGSCRANRRRRPSGAQLGRCLSSPSWVRRRSGPSRAGGGPSGPDGKARAEQARKSRRSLIGIGVGSVSSEQVVDDFTRRCQADAGQVGGPDAEPGEDRGAEVGGSDRPVDRVLAAAVGGADDPPATDASPGQEGRVTGVPVVAARRGR